VELEISVLRLRERYGMRNHAKSICGMPKVKAYLKIYLTLRDVGLEHDKE
jgi:hypothetical protein